MPNFQPANEHLGYYFHPSTEAHAIGAVQLDVVIRPAPTGDHIDPQAVECHVADDDRSTRLHITHPWTQEMTYRVCSGEIDIEGMRHEHVKAFTFGGTLRIDSFSQRTLCQITSPAPLLEHTKLTSSAAEQLIEEVQILFAERRAAQDDDDFARKLAAVDPLQLYQACLVALNEKFAHFPAADESHRQFKQFLHTTTSTFTTAAVDLAELL
jgi:hypothetical protein